MWPFCPTSLLPIFVAMRIYEFCLQKKGSEWQFGSAVVLTCSLYLGFIGGREISVGFSLGFFFDWLVSCFLVVVFWGGVLFFWFVDGFLDLRVNNYFIVTLTLSTPSVWMRRGGIDVVTKMEGNCWKEKASNPKGRLGLLFLHRQHELTAAKYCVSYLHCLSYR